VHGSPFFLQEQLSVLQEPLLRNIVNGVVAHELVTVHKHEEVARAIMHNMIGKPVFTFTFKRKDNAITLGEMSAVRIASDRTILFRSSIPTFPHSGQLSHESCHWRRLRVTNSVLSLLPS